MTPKRWLYTVPLRLRSVFRRRQVEDELDDELRFHLEQQIAQNIADGMDPAAARREARLTLDGVELCKEECRDTRRLNLFDDLVRDAVYALRVLRKSPAFALTAILTIALGVGANTAIFSVFQDFLLRPLPFHDPGRLVMVTQFNPALAVKVTGYVSPPNYLDWKAQNHVFEDMAAWDGSSEQFDLTGADEPERVRGKRVSSSFFPVLGARPLLGSLFGPDQDRRGGDTVVLLSYALWQRRFGGRADVLGTQVKLDGKSRVVVGVMPAGFHFSAPPEEVWLPMAGVLQGGRGGMHLSVVARLKPGVKLAQARRDMAAIAARLAAQYPEDNRDTTARVNSLRDRYAGTLRPALVVLLAAAGLVLLIACANIAAVLLARATARHKEIAMRRALGASRSRIIRQSLTESLLLACVGGTLGVLLSIAAVPLLYSAIPAGMRPLEAAGIDVPMLLVALLASAGTGLLFGLAPALRAAGSDLQSGLKESAAAGPFRGGRRRLGSALVVAQMALAVMLLIGAGLLIRSFVRLLDVDMGFRAENVLTMNLAHSSNSHAFFSDVLQRVSALPGVKAAGAANFIPINETSWGQNIVIEGRPPRAAGDLIWAQHRSVSLDYFRAMGIRLLQGRRFVDQDLRESAAIINEAMARAYWPGEDPLGKRFKIGIDSKRWISVVGVIGNVKYYGLDTETPPEMYFFESMSRMTLTVRAAIDPTSLIAAVRGVIRSVDRNQAVSDVRTMQRIVDESVAPRRLTMLLTAVFAALALLLAAFGLYGLVSYSVAMQRHDIGIRMAIGARPADILRSVLRNSLAMALSGVALGLAGAWGLARLTTSLLFGVTAHDPVVFLAVPLLLTAVMLAAAWLPAHRAARIDPLQALRCE